MLIGKSSDTTNHKKTEKYRLKAVMILVLILLGGKTLSTTTKHQANQEHKLEAPNGNSHESTLTYYMKSNVDVLNTVYWEDVKIREKYPNYKEIRAYIMTIMDQCFAGISMTRNEFYDKTRFYLSKSAFTAALKDLRENDGKGLTWNEKIRTQIQEEFSEEIKKLFIYDKDYFIYFFEKMRQWKVLIDKIKPEAEDGSSEGLAVGIPQLEAPKDFISNSRILVQTIRMEYPEHFEQYENKLGKAVYCLEDFIGEIEIDFPEKGTKLDLETFFNSMQYPLFLPKNELEIHYDPNLSPLGNYVNYIKTMKVNTAIKFRSIIYYDMIYDSCIGNSFYFSSGLKYMITGLVNNDKVFPAYASIKKEKTTEEIVRRVLEQHTDYQSYSIEQREKFIENQVYCFDRSFNSAEFEKEILLERLEFTSYVLMFRGISHERFAGKLKMIVELIEVFNANFGKVPDIADVKSYDFAKAFGTGSNLDPDPCGFIFSILSNGWENYLDY